MLVRARLAGAVRGRLRVVGVDARQVDDEARPGRGVLEHDVAAVGDGDGLHDREARGPVEPPRSPLAAHEALEDAVAQLGRHARPVVLRP